MESLHESQRAIEALLARENQRGIKSENIVLAGFSQGGALAFHTGLRYPEKLAGVMALSCHLPLPQTLASGSASGQFRQHRFSWRMARAIMSYR